MEETATTEGMDFPLSSAKEAVDFMKRQIIESKDEVDLVLISVVLGYIEHRLTVENPSFAAHGPGEVSEKFPVIRSEDVMPLVEEFRRYVRDKVTPKVSEDAAGSVITDRQTIKDVANAIWKRLSKSFHKDKPHFQTLYTFKNGSHLDCFGLAYAVAAGCQVLGCSDVHLCLSEDHAWIVFGKDGSQTAEITWNGKQNEGYRGEPIDNNLVSSKNWLYLGGNPVVCETRRMEATAAVAMINCSINNVASSDHLSHLQQDLLWVLYDAGCLSRYPMALCILAELQEKHSDLQRLDADEVFHQAIDCSRSVYGDNHVYPYTEYGCYLLRKEKYAEALFRWQQAADVLRKYCYNKEEEELHKEIAKIAHELIPNCFKTVHEAGHASQFFQSSENLTNLLLFYDGICEWEQNGTTPIFHNFWAKPFAQSIGQFNHDIRLALLASSAGADEAEKVMSAPPPSSPGKNVEAFHRSLVKTVLNVYGNGAPRRDEPPKEGQCPVDEFVRICETSQLKADLVWTTVGAGPSHTNRETPISHQLQFRSAKMESLRTILSKKVIRPADVELILCAQIESTCGGTDCRRSERKRQKIG